MNFHAGLLLALGLLVAADAEDNDPKTGATKKPADQIEIQGTWVGVQAECDGRELPKEEAGKMRLTFKGNKVIYVYGETKRQGTFKLDAKKKPKRFDTEFKHGEAMEVLHAIYLLQGNVLKICWDNSGKGRPMQFKTAKDSWEGLVRYKRGKM